MLASDIPFDEAKVLAALEKLAIPALLAAIPTGLSERDLDNLLGLLSRSNQLLFKYPNPSRELLRDNFLNELRIHISKTCGLEAVDRIERLARAFNQIESGYRGILQMLNGAPIRQQPSAIQATAVLHRAAAGADDVRNRVISALKGRKAFHLMDDPTAVDGLGVEFSVDSVMTALVEGVRITLLMLGHEKKWFSPTGQLILPSPLPSCDDEIRDQVGSIEILASCWQRWERVEQKLRFWGGALVDVPFDRFPKDWPSDLTCWQYNSAEGDIYDWVANERLKESAIQNFGRIMMETSADRHVADISGSVEMAPSQFVSLQEISALGYLSQIIGDDITTDDRLFGGLRLIEWLRGYAALASISQRAYRENAGSLRHLITFAPGQLSLTLQRVGISLESSNIFIGAASLNVNSLDFFDTPLIELADGGHILFGPASIDVDAGRALLSRLNSLGHSLESKGRAFERDVLRFFEKQGLRAFRINTKRDEEPYELDVLVPWDKYLFLFECKNRSLSDHQPMQAYYFERSCQRYIQQVKRQFNGLLKYPEMISELGVDPREMIIVPCILFSLPYARSGSHDDVYISDWSSLSRFFEDRYFYAKDLHGLGDVKVLHRTRLCGQWTGDRPSAEDLLRHLSDPIQVKIMLSRMVLKPAMFQIGPNRIVQTMERSRGPLSFELLGEIMGFDPQWVRQEQARVLTLVKKTRKSLRRRKRKKKD